MQLGFAKSQIYVIEASFAVQPPMQRGQEGLGAAVGLMSPADSTSAAGAVPTVTVWLALSTLSALSVTVRVTLYAP